MRGPRRRVDPLAMPDDPKAQTREPTDATTLTVQGVEVPKLGYGTWQVTGDDAVDGVRDALELGFRHIDTARMYENEEEVGRGIRDSGVDRGEIFLTTKVWMDDAAPDRLRASAEGSLGRLGVDHVDLLLLHWPNPDVPIADTVGELARLQEEGKVTRFGVSNFPSRLLEEALEHGPVFANQVEYHPYLGQPALLRLARERDLLLEAYSPFAHGRLLDDPVLAEIGEAHGKSVGQVALRWLLDQPQVVALPKASSHERRAQNLDVFDFELTEEQRSRIAHLERGLRTASPPWAPEWD
jgi:2,5-diketo-D-gluconate reductase B